MTIKELYDVIIIGGGPGGLTAGIYSKRAAQKTLLIEKGYPGGQLASTDIVENWPGIEQIGGAELAENMIAHAKSYDLEILQEEVVSVVPGSHHHTVQLANGDVYFSHTVIIAVGGSPKELHIPGEKEFYGKGVSYCAVCDGFFYRNKTVVVVGGGDSATEESLYLAKIAKHVYLVHRRDSFRAERMTQDKVLSNDNITVIWNTVVTSVVGDVSGVTAVNLKNTKTAEPKQLATDGVFVFIGFKPNNQLVPSGTPLDKDGYVVTDCKGETNTPGIFVIGDLRLKYAKQVVVAAGEGATAALAAAHCADTIKKAS